MKSYYFKAKEISASNIQEEIDFFITDYSYSKPCHKHKFFTPEEVHINLVPIKILPF